MSEITAVPLRPVAKGAIVSLWLGVALATAAGIGLAYYGTGPQVAMAQTPADFLARNAKRDGVVTTPSGLQYQVLEPGSGPKAGAQDVVLVDYDGKLANGETFDASARHGGPATLPVGGLIPGWTEGLQLMSQGAKYRFWIRPELGYGAEGAGNGVIPPNALLIFDVHLVAIAPQSGLGLPGGMGGPAGAGAGGMGGAPHGDMGAMPPGMGQ